MIRPVFREITMLKCKPAWAASIAMKERLLGIAYSRKF